LPDTVALACCAVLQFVPHQRTLGLFARQAGFAEAVFDGVEGDLDLVAYGNFELAPFVLELLDRNNAFGLEPRIDHNDVVADLDDDAGNDRARLQFGQRLALFKQFGKTLSVMLVPSCLKTGSKLLMYRDFWSTCYGTFVPLQFPALFANGRTANRTLFRSKTRVIHSRERRSAR
jgi:hypothetical protein